MRKSGKSRDYLLAQIHVERGASVESVPGGGVRHGEDGSIEVVFAGTPTPQLLRLGSWPGREPLVEGLATWLFEAHRSSRYKTRKAGHSRLRAFLAWLVQHDKDGAVKEAKDVTQSVVDSYLRHLKSSSLKDASRRHFWYTFKSSIEWLWARTANPEAPELYLQRNPFPLSNGRSIPTEPLTIEEVKRFLWAAKREMDQAWGRCDSEKSSYGGPTLREIVPFWCALALYTSMNPDTIIGLDTGDIYDDGECVTVRGTKYRAGKQQQATLKGSDDNILDGPLVVRRVIRMTAVLRETAPAKFAERLFLARSECSRMKGVVVGMSVDVRPDLRVTRAFGLKHGIPDLSLKRLRATSIALARMLDGGISATALLGNSVAVAEHHYKSGGARKQDRVALARQIEIRTRFARTGGKRDVRDHHGAPQSAATPGFTCVDPFAPPFELRQREGMCAAFLECPACPQAGIMPNDPQTAAELLRLRASLMDAKAAVPPPRWRAAYAKPYELIGVWLERMTAEAVTAGESIPLSPLPTLE